MPLSRFEELPAEIQGMIFDYVVVIPDHEKAFDSWVATTDPWRTFTPSSLLVSKTYFSRAQRSYYQRGDIKFFGTLTGTAAFQRIPEDMKKLITTMTIVEAQSLGATLYNYINPTLARSQSELQQLVKLFRKIAAYIQPDMETVPFLGGHLSRSAIDTILTQCPRLVHLEFKTVCPEWNERGSPHTILMMVKWWGVLSHIPNVVVPDTFWRLRSFFAIKRVLQERPAWTMAQ